MGRRTIIEGDAILFNWDVNHVRFSKVPLHVVVMVNKEEDEDILGTVEDCSIMVGKV